MIGAQEIPTSTAAIEDTGITSVDLKPADYVHLHNHTQFSLLDGLTRIPDLVEYVKETGMQSVAMTDHGTLSGAIEFYKEARDKGVKPILGIETYVASRKHTDKDPQKDKQRFHLIIMAMNETGWQNLMKLSTIANLDGYYYYPRVDHDLLEKYNEGLIISSACMGGEVGQKLLNDDYEGAKQIAQWYKKVFGDRYYLEIQDHGHPDNPIYSPEQGKMNKYVLELGKDLDIPVVVTCDAHYLKHEHQDSHEILLCIGTGAFLSDEKRMSLKNYPLHVEDPQEIIKRWGAEHPEVIRNTKAIADRVDLTIELDKILIPEFPVPEGETEKTFFDKAVYRGLAWRYGGVPEADTAEMTIDEAKKHIPADALKRAEYELGVVDSMGFNGYFLIVSDFISWGKNQGIIFGPGRGSAAGSILAYAVKITDLDPLKYDLLFERFLNPDRISMPDVDIDIQDTRREEVIQYCVQKYGTNRVSNIVTFGRMFARNAVRDVARVMQVPYADADRLAKMIPQPVQGKHIPLAKSLKEDMDLAREYAGNDVSRQVLDQAMILEGTVRSHGVHACGVIIAPDDLVKFVPLEMAQKGVVTAQFPMGQVEELGLLKMDFLGLSNLTIIKNCLRIIKRVYGEEIDLASIPLDFKGAYELLGSGDTTGVFQLESAGMKRYLKELKPTVFEDIIAMVALYRPGPMQFIDEFIARKHGTKKIIYPHDSMENSLKNTYGVLVYQEQVMQISKEVCGFTGGEADTLRKAIGKKKIDLMAKMKDKMISGALEVSGIPNDLMERFWKQLEDFAAYCFNKSHAACYGLIAYWTAYLKARYPSAFMAAVMTSDYDDTDRLAIEIAECQHMGINVLPPDVNESFHEFAVVKTEDNNPKADIRFGMNAIKNVGSGAVDEILRARNLDGDFTDIEDFLSRVNVRICNRKNLESLIKAGAMDRFGDRSQLLHNLDVALAYAQRLQKERNSGQTDLFGNLIEEHAAGAKSKLIMEKAAVVFTPREQLLWERELLGLYLSQHPLSMFETYLEEQSMDMSQLIPEHEGRGVVVGGAINDVREITTKNGAKMAFVKLEDKHAELELILFPGAYQQTAGLWERDRVILARGKVSAKDREGNLGEEVKILVDDAREITGEQAQAYQATGRKMRPPGSKHSPAAAVTATKGKDPEAKKPKEPPKPKPSGLGQKLPERVYIRLADSGNQTLLMTLKQTIDAARGQTEVVLVLGESKQVIKLPGGVTKEPQLIKQLCSLVGDENVKVQ
ncbi:MAG TPA: DNA polymerase III subunit alpha [Candidatus Saccharimonadales bacterium]|nr:DNA polymerase III subunit alpha [Candidatus Saccharimonadales bacterium]